MKCRYEIVDETLYRDDRDFLIGRWVAFRNGYQINLDIIASSDESEMVKLRVK